MPIQERSILLRNLRNYLTFLKDYGFTIRFGLPRLFHPREGRFTAITTDVPPQNQKWVYWNNSTRRFQLWRGVATHDVQIVTRFLRGSDKTVAFKVVKKASNNNSVKAY